MLQVNRPQKSDDECAGWLRWLCRLWKILTAGRKGGDACVYIPERIITRPDPCIYSQFLLMQLGQPVTWDNPDVAIVLNGVEQNTYDLTVDTEYEIVITLHNSSRDKPATGTQVDVRWIEFGAGGQTRHPLANLGADIPIWPGTTTVTTRWRTPATPGHYCIEVELFHPNDGNPSNNRGWNNTQVKAAASRVEAPVRIFNRWIDGCPPIAEGGDAISWWRVLLGYGLVGVATALPLQSAVFPQGDGVTGLAALPTGYVAGASFGWLVELIRANIGRSRTRARGHKERISCHLVELTVDSYVFHDGTGKEVDPVELFAPRPPAWPARVEPRTFAFGPGETYRDVTLTVDAPDTPGPAESFNVNAWQGGVPAGGATITVTRKGR